MIYMKSENRKTSNAHRLSLTLIDKMDLQRGKKRVHYQNLVSTTNERI